MLDLERRRESVLKPAFKLWLENGRKKVVLDQTDALLLRFISEKHSLTEAAKLAGISYRNAWDRVKSLEEDLGRRVVATSVGGKAGGRTELTADGEGMVAEFRRTRNFVLSVLDDRETWSDLSYKLSSRNRVRARVLEVRRGETTSLVKMEALGRPTLTAVITNEAAEELGLGPKDVVEAVVKSTDVMVGKLVGRERRSEPI